MPRPDPPLLDERLSRLGREWFAEARRQEKEDERREARHASGDGGDGPLDWLFGDGDDAGSSDAGDGGGD